jgi:multiple sugar transport system permease protein
MSMSGVRREEKRFSGPLLYALVLLGAAIILPPLVWVFVTSLKLGTDTVRFPPEWIPSPATLTNYAEVIGGSSRFFLNSLILAVGSIVLSLAICVPAAYVATRFRRRWLETYMTLILIAAMVPAMAVLVSIYAMLAKTSLINTYPLLTLVYTGMISGQVIIFLRSFIENIPQEIEEAAAIDGCKRGQILVKIVLPLIRPGIAAIAIFIFVFVWNDYLIGTTLTTTESMRTVQNGLVRYLQTNYGTSWGLFSAYVMLAFTPVLVVFFAFQKWFVAGLTAGGVKG